MPTMTSQFTTYAKEKIVSLLKGKSLPEPEIINFKDTPCFLGDEIKIYTVGDLLYYSVKSNGKTIWYQEFNSIPDFKKGDTFTIQGIKIILPIRIKNP